MIKQYVNLPVKAADHHGSRVTLEVQANNLGTTRIGVSEWWVEDAPGATNTALKYLSATERARPRRTHSRNQSNTFRNTLLLPHTGGDKYKVKCSKRGNRSSPVDVEEFETWRKIYYTVHYMNAQCLATFTAVKARFEDAFKTPAFIELEQAGSLQTLVDEPNTLASNSLPHLYRRHPPLANKPFHLRIVVLNDIYDLEDGEYDERSVTSLITMINTENPLSDVSPTHWLRQARARVVGRRNQWLNIQRYTTKVSDTEIRVDVTGHRQLAAAINAGQRIRIRIRTRERDHYLGHSIGNFCCVRINETGTPAEIETTILQTFTHEVGHGFQQVVRRERTYDGNGNFKAWERNPMHHDDRFGGQGPHCAVNARRERDPDTPSGWTYEHNPGAGSLCTMFFRDDDAVDSDGKFCDSHCTPRLRRVNLDAAHMRAQGWGRF
ncbi:hypothetical protein [Sorangium sp. So ce861]|uniref:hypothetical protein n=1 Tax=Sorangium sp. So ce861 TaxID=3133323 RepID=UPI003F5F2F8C